KQSLDAEQVYLDSLLAQRVAEEHERESRASTAQPTQRQAKLDRISLNLTNKEWIGLVDQVQANLILSAELLGADVSKDTFSNVYNKIQRVVDLATAKDHHQQLKWSGETLEYSESKKLKSSHNTEQSAELPDTTFVSAGATISAASVPIIDLLDSPPKATSLPLDPATAEQAVPLRKSSRKKSMARRRTLPRPSQSGSAALFLTKMILKPNSRNSCHYKSRWYCQEIFYFERATGIGLGLWLDLRTLITAREDRDASIIWDDQDQWVIRSWRFYALPTIHVLETKAGDIMYMFVDKKYPILPATIQRMLNHGLEIDRDPFANDLTTAI
nr:hypothetical protein [Tanacetum cinerariifolium]